MASRLAQQERTAYKPAQLHDDALAVDESRGDEVEKLLDEFEIVSRDDVDLQLYQQHKDNDKLRLTDGNVNILKPGDLVELSYYKLLHLVVVENVRTQPDKPPGFVIIDAIHYGRPNLWTPNRIIRETFERNLIKEECWLQLLPPASCYPPETVLQRARSRLNEQEHSPPSNNAALFALWCKTESPTHRPDSRVPIYLSDQHPIHEVKVGDHLDVKCCGNELVHAQVTEVAALGDRSLLTVLAREDDVMAKAVQFVHETQQQKLEGKILRVVSDPVKVNSKELGGRIQLMKNLVFKSKTTSLSVSLLLTDTNHTVDDWALRVTDPPSAAETAPLCQTVNPGMLNAGDIIYWQDVYRVVTAVRSDGSGHLVSTVQYYVGPVEGKPELLELKVLLGRKETDAVLHVHNQTALDCQLYGGGRDKPSYSTVKVTDIRQISKGCVISIHRSGFYQHAVVIKNSIEDESSTEGGDESSREVTKSSLDVMSYVLDPSLSTEQFKIPLRTIDLDISSQETFLVEYPMTASAKYSDEETVARAFSRQGEREHNLLWNNGRDFARWCSIKHPSNREQCRVPITSAGQLLQFQKGHIKFHKLLDQYTHDAIMRDCSSVDGCEDIVRVRLYERNDVFRTVRCESLQIRDGESVVRVKYDGVQLCDIRDLDQLMNCTFLSADDDSMGWTQKSRKCGSKVTSLDFCYWLKTMRSPEGLQDIQRLFGSQLSALQVDIKKLCKYSVLSSQPDVSVSLESSGDRRNLRQFDHVILTRKVGGKDAEVHFILTEWDQERCSGVGVTYEKPPDYERVGVKEFNGFLRVRPGEIVKVVHNSELDWDAIDAKFLQCQGQENYNLFKNNCEHFVNFLIYGRFTSLQISDLTSTAVACCPSIGVQFARGVGKFANIVGRMIRFLADISPSVPDGRTVWAESVGLFLVLGFSALEVALLEMRKATTGMSSHEFKQRRRGILASLVSALVGLGGAMFFGITSVLPLLGIGLSAMGIGWAVPRVPAILEGLSKP